MKPWEILAGVVGILGIAAVFVLLAWGAMREERKKQWDPHCVCSQQTCFVAPDGGWRQ